MIRNRKGKKDDCLLSDTYYRRLIMRGKWYRLQVGYMHIKTWKNKVKVAQHPLLLTDIDVSDECVACSWPARVGIACLTPRRLTPLHPYILSSYQLLVWSYIHLVINYFLLNFLLGAIFLYKINYLLKFTSDSHIFHAVKRASLEILSSARNNSMANVQIWGNYGFLHISHNVTDL